MRAPEDVKSWLGTEPFLGIVTLAIVLPLAGLLGYMVAESALSAPLAFSILIAVWMTGLLVDHIARQVSEPLGRKINLTFFVLFYTGLAAWTFRDEFLPWHGFTLAIIAKILLFALVIGAMIKLDQRQRNNPQLPDYCEK